MHSGYYEDAFYLNNYNVAQFLSERYFFIKVMITTNLSAIILMIISDLEAIDLFLDLSDFLMKPAVDEVPFHLLLNKIVNEFQYSIYL